MNRAATIALVTTLALAGCGGGEAESSDEQELQDGHYFGYIRSVDTSSTPATIAFDGAEFLTGADGEQAARDDGALAPGEPLSNDYYVRNPDRRPETLELAPDAGVTAVRCPTSCSEKNPGELDAFLASFSREEPATLMDDYRGARSQYWITVERGLVTQIDEQYVP